MPRWLRLNAEIAWDRNAAFDDAHGERHRDVDRDVDYGCCSKRLEHLKRKFLHRAGPGGQLHKSDRQLTPACSDARKTAISWEQSRPRTMRATQTSAEC